MSEGPVWVSEQPPPKRPSPPAMLVCPNEDCPVDEAVPHAEVLLGTRGGLAHRCGACGTVLATKRQAAARRRRRG